VDGADREHLLWNACELGLEGTAAEIKIGPPIMTSAHKNCAIVPAP